MKITNDFKSFLLRGNVIDMAVGIIIGAAFTSIVQSLVDDIVMPFLSLFTSGINYEDTFFVLKSGIIQEPYATLNAAKEAGAITVNIGLFFSSLLSFLLVSFCLFILLRIISKIYRNPPQKSTPRQEILLEEIRDAITGKTA